MKSLKYYLSALCMLLMIACGGNKEQSKSEQKSVTALTYRQFFELMFEDFGSRVEWHEDDFNQEAKAAIEIYQQGGCDTENCGKKVFVKNTSDKTVRVVTKTSFSIPDTLPFIANQFIMKPGDEVYLTCTQFCYGGETFDLANEIVVAEFTEETAN